MRFKLIEKRQETPSIYSFIFKPEEAFHFMAGQFIDITVPHENPDSRGIRRHFSITSSPTEENIMIATRIIENGSTFKKAFLSLKEGSLVEAGEAHGSFILPNDQNTYCIFITGGVGITPVRSILKYAMDKQIRNRLVLLFSNRTAEEIPFYDFLNELETHNPKLTVAHTISRPEESKIPWTGRIGRLDERLVREHIRYGKQTIFYLCGPTSLVQTFYEFLTSMGITDEQIKRENFPGY